MAPGNRSKRDRTDNNVADRIRAALGLPPSTAIDEIPGLITDLVITNVKHATESDSVRNILDADYNHYDESLSDIARMRMNEINSFAIQHSQIRDIIGADAGKPLVEAVRAKMGELKELKVELMQREQCEYMEIDPDPSAIPIGRLLTDNELRRKINELASVLDYSNLLEDLKK